jgi:hypothetical protein
VEADLDIDNGEHSVRADQEQIDAVTVQQRNKLSFVPCDDVPRMGREDRRHGIACQEISTAMVHDLGEIPIPSGCLNGHRQSLLRASSLRQSERAGNPDASSDRFLPKEVGQNSLIRIPPGKVDVALTSCDGRGKGCKGMVCADSSGDGESPNQCDCSR